MESGKGWLVKTLGAGTAITVAAFMILWSQARFLGIDPKISVVGRLGDDPLLAGLVLMQFLEVFGTSIFQPTRDSVLMLGSVAGLVALCEYRHARGAVTVLTNPPLRLLLVFALAGFLLVFYVAPTFYIKDVLGSTNVAANKRIEAPPVVDDPTQTLWKTISCSRVFSGINECCADDLETSRRQLNGHFLTFAGLLGLLWWAGTRAPEGGQATKQSMLSRRLTFFTAVILTVLGLPGVYTTTIMSTKFLAADHAARSSEQERHRTVGMPLYLLAKDNTNGLVYDRGESKLKLVPYSEIKEDTDSQDVLQEHLEKFQSQCVEVRR